MGDDAAAILCGVPCLSVPGCRFLVLYRHAEAEESCRARTSSDLCATLTPIGPANPRDGAPLDDHHRLRGENRQTDDNRNDS